MFRTYAHAFVATVMHVLILFAAHKIAVEVIALVRDEIVVTFSEGALALLEP